MELELLEACSKIDRRFVLLSEDEYAYSVGSMIVVKQLKTSSSSEMKTLK